MTSGATDGAGDYPAVFASAEAALGTALTGEHRRRILAAGRQAEYAASHGPAALPKAGRAEAGRRAAEAELAAIVAEVRPLSGGAPAEATEFAALTLTIRGEHYRVEKVECPDRSAALACYSVRKRGADEAYHVSEHPTGLRCTCGDYEFRRQHLDPKCCKHVRALAAVGLIRYTDSERAASAAGGSPGGDPFPRPVRAGLGVRTAPRPDALTDGPGLDTWAGWGHRA